MLHFHKPTAIINIIKTKSGKDGRDCGITVYILGIQSLE